MGSSDSDKDKPIFAYAGIRHYEIEYLEYINSKLENVN